MAVIPVYDTQVAVRPMPGVRWTEQGDPNAYGANIAAAQAQTGKMLTGLGAEISDTAVKLQRQQDANTVLTASNKWDETTNKLLYDKDSGLFAQKGEKALGVIDQMNKDLPMLTNQIMGELKAPRLQQKFMQVIANRQSAIQEAVMRHEMKERDTWSQDTTNGAMANAINSIKLGYTDQNIIDANLRIGEAAIMKRAAEIGMSSEGLQAEFTKFKQQAHIAVINRYIADENGNGARAYFDKNKAEIPDAATVEEAVTKLENYGESQEVVKELIGKYGENEEAAVAELEKRYSNKPVKFDRFKRDLLGEISHLRDRKNKAEEDAYDAVIQNALAVRKAGGSINDALKALELNPVLKGRHLITAASQIKQLFGVDEEGLPKTTPRGVWTEVFYGIETGQIKNLKQLLMQYGDKISRSDYESFSRAVMTGTDDEKLGWSTILGKIVKENTIPDRDIPLLYQKIGESFQAYRQKNGGPPSLAEKEAIVNDLMKKTITSKGYVIDSTERKFKTNFPTGSNIRWNSGTNANEYVDDDGTGYQMSYDKPQNRWYITKDGKRYWVDSD